jgi:hypothetical protein
MTKLAHYPEIMLGVLIEILGLDGLATTRRLLSKRGVPLIIVARVRCQLPRIAELTNPLRLRCSLRRLMALVRCGLYGRLRGLWSKAFSGFGVGDANQPKRFSRRMTRRSKRRYSTHFG